MSEASAFTPWNPGNTKLFYAAGFNSSLSGNSDIIFLPVSLGHCKESQDNLGDLKSSAEAASHKSDGEKHDFDLAIYGRYSKSDVDLFCFCQLGSTSLIIVCYGGTGNWGFLVCLGLSHQDRTLYLHKVITYSRCVSQVPQVWCLLWAAQKMFFFVAKNLTMALMNSKLPQDPLSLGGFTRRFSRKWLGQGLFYPCQMYDVVGIMSQSPVYVCNTYLGIT